MVRHIPIEAYLSWPAPNYSHPKRRGPAIQVINALFMLLVTLAIIARLYVRIFIRRWFGSDDVFIVISFIPTLGLAICISLGMTKYCWDVHVYDLPLTMVTPSSKLFYTAKAIMPIAAASVRISLCCFYYRLLARTGMRQFKWVIHCALFFIVSLAIFSTCTNIFMCRPVRSYWIFPQLPGSHCLPEGPILLASAAVNTFAELVVTTLPIPMVLYLPMERKQRFTVIALLSMGFTVCFAGCARTYFVWLSMVGTYDQTWWSYPHWICAVIEVDLAVICACAPALRPLFLRLYPQLGRSPKQVRLARGPGSQNRCAKTHTRGADHTRLPTVSNNRYNILWSPKSITSYPGTIVYQTIDFDDLDQGEFGNTVEITATRKRRKLEKRPSTLMRQSSSRDKLQKKRSRKDMGSKDQSPQKLEIMTQHSFDMHESIHEVRESAEIRQLELYWAENGGSGPDGDSLKFHDWGLLSRSTSRRDSGDEEKQVGFEAQSRSEGRSSSASNSGRGSAGSNSRKASTEASLIDSMDSNKSSPERSATKSAVKVSFDEKDVAEQQSRQVDQGVFSRKSQENKKPQLPSPTSIASPIGNPLSPISAQLRRSLSERESRRSDQHRRSRDSSYQLLSGPSWSRTFENLFTTSPKREKNRKPSNSQAAEA